MRLTLLEIAFALGCGTVLENADAWGGAACEALAESGLLPEALHHVCPTGAAIDSREVTPGCLFFCFRGERVDGHDFARDAAKNGALAIVAEHNPFVDALGNVEHGMPPVLVVPNVTVALQRLAKSHRETSLAKVVGITGTAGKTSVKDVLVQVLASHAQTSCNRKNFNNGIGLPLSMLNASAEATFWVMEVGISQPHDMDELGQLLEPDIALVLNVGAGHTEGLGDKGVAHYKSRLFRYVEKGGTVLYNADYPDLVAEVSAMEGFLQSKSIVAQAFSGTAGKAAYCARFVPEQPGQYALQVDGKRVAVAAPFMGPYGAENVAAIFAVATLLGLQPEAIVKGLSQATLPEQRFTKRQVGPFTLVDDSYNANPLSMSRMIEAATLMAKNAAVPLVLVLGEMGELGSVAPSAHEALGKAIAASGACLVFWKGGYGENVRAGLKQGDFHGHFYPVLGGQDFFGLLEELELKHGVFLFKGSRMNRLERLVEVFTNQFGA
ncbi:UDP-N-acetylmuramoyl-tripeptide--D-alanyl-D-alanine ligase [Desulfovibrio cuneatus]|uniref:UDP-N-acetylmuramoyl-tripeptide--D-alanyl-D- alanine ligase n=1 Tax=Desulfovibrio cuneatus TaxID=159728 RepID=UPI000428E278|nr:UDP-N-acetylmuramoyl-tripeptide--D-alanyl-D-alanine ligase [Desulfovibrio cuneatus]